MEKIKLFYDKISAFLFKFYAKYYEYQNEIITVIRIISLLFLELLLYVKINFLSFLIGIGVIVFKILQEFGLLKKLKLEKKELGAGILYTKDFRGAYKKNGLLFKEAFDLCGLDKSKQSTPIGIYYDPSSVPDEKKRCSVGVYFRKKEENDKPDEEYEKKMIEKGFLKTEIPASECVFGNWSYTSYIFYAKGAQKFYGQVEELMGKGVDEILGNGAGY